jgi:WD40 repeat protein
MDNYLPAVIKRPVANGVVPSNISALAFSADSKSIWVLSYDGTLRQWNIDTSKFTLEQEIAIPIFAADWNADGTRLAVGVTPDTPILATALPQDNKRSLEEIGLKVIVPSSST